MRLLLALAPHTATTTSNDQQTPLHLAAKSRDFGENVADQVATLQLLLEAAPQAASLTDAEGNWPLHCAWASGNEAAALCLLGAGPADAVLDAIKEADLSAAARQRYFAEFARLRIPLTGRQWSRFPSPCAGIGRALPPALEHSSVQASNVVWRLPPADVQRLRTAALALVREQKRLRIHLPAPPVGRILSLLFAD